MVFDEKPCQLAGANQLIVRRRRLQRSVNSLCVADQMAQRFDGETACGRSGYRRSR
jgi:hypothetical protein